MLKRKTDVKVKQKRKTIWKLIDRLVEINKQPEAENELS